MTLYTVVTSGCDDATNVQIELTADEAQAIAKVARAINAASNSGCEPTLAIKPGVHDYLNEQVEVAE